LQIFSRTGDIFMGPHGSGTVYQFGGNGILTLGAVSFGGGGTPGSLTLNEGGLGSSIIKGTLISGNKYTVGTLPTCDFDSEGSRLSVLDSTTQVWGATVTGLGALPVLAYCDGTNWTVFAK
jgi:hypothetical protein